MKPHFKFSTVSAAVAVCCFTSAGANPQNPQVLAGSATFSQHGAQLNVTNSANTIIRWDTFSVGANEMLRFAQPNASAAVLNRVSGGSASQLLGQIQSNGRVFLVNPAGVIVGAGARIDTAGFVASSLAMSDGDFLAGRLRFAQDGPAGLVRNDGLILGGGGLVALVGQQVQNNGHVASPGGNVVLAAGRQVELLDAYSPHIRVRLSPAVTDDVLHTVLQRGVLTTALPLGTDAAGVRTVGGRIMLYSAGDAQVDADARLDASAADGGKVMVVAGRDARVHGEVLATGTHQGGFIETSGTRALDVSGITVRATGAQPGTWLLDPLNIEVVTGAGMVSNGGATAFTPNGSNSQIGADLIAAQLDAGTNVILDTAVAGADAGNITISAPIVKTANNAASLTLTANNNITVNQNITLANNPTTGTSSGLNSTFTATAGGTFAIHNATVSAFNVNVNATSIERSGTQTNDFIFGFLFPTSGALNLTTTAGAVGTLANPVRFTNPDTAGRTWAINTTAAGAAGHVFIQPTATDYGTFGGTAIQTNAATTQTVRVNHTGTGTFSLYGSITGNDDWTLNSAGSFNSTNFGGGGNGGILTANSITATVAGNFGGTSAAATSPGTVFDTAAANGNITMTGGLFHGSGCGGDNLGFGVKPGTGTVTATSTGGGLCAGIGSIQLAHFGGDLLTSRYVLNFAGGSAGAYMRLKAGDGNLIVDSTTGFGTSLNDKEVLLQTLAAGKDILFQGGTVQGGRVEIRAARNVDNLAPGTAGFIQTNAFGGPHWRLVAGGGIGMTNPVEGQVNWVGSLVSGGVGSAGNMRIKFTGGSPRFGEVRTDAGSAQNINIESTVGVIFSIGQPGFASVIGGGAASQTANDAYSVNAGGSLHFDQFNNSMTAASFTSAVGGGVSQGTSGTSRWVSTTGTTSITANGGGMGSASP